MVDLSRYAVTILPCHEIFCDNDFNCRGMIDRSTCVELADDIKARGLDFPIHVQPYNLKSPFKYRIVAGHRRFTAVSVLNKEPTIPAIIRTDLTDELDAREANLRENIQRKDLTLLQEAEAVSFFILAGNNENQIAKRLGKSPGWVAPRRKLMGLPEFVRKAANDGVVTQNHINQMWNYRDDPAKLADMIRMIKERAEKGERAIVIKEDMKITDFAAVRRPKPHEIEDILIVIADNITNKLPDGEENFGHRVGAWCAGYLSQAQIYMSIKRECERLGLPFKPPSDIERIMESVVKAA